MSELRHDTRLHRRRKRIGPVPVSDDRQVELFGFLGAGGHGHNWEERIVVGTLGQEGVTVVGGWGKWAQVPRRQLQAVTVIEGYEPLTVSVPLLLDAKVVGKPNIEHDVESIEWMGG